MPNTTRRTFIKSTAVTGAALALPACAAGPARRSANGKLNVAVVGVGGMGGYAVREAAKQNLVAFCDVDAVRAAKAYEKYPQVPRYQDFRVMLDELDQEIDAVAISTPDHTHFAIAMEAIQRGKHVFVQKPLAHNIWELRTLLEAARHHKVITQMGNQGHTFDGFRRIQEWVGAGVLGEVREVVAWTNRPCKPWFVAPRNFPIEVGEPPATLAWDLWQGPVAARPYSREYVPMRWRSWWDYGCGGLGDIGCHTFDAPFQALQLGSPTKVEVEREAPPGPGFISMKSIVTYHFPARGKLPPVKMTWYEAQAAVPKPERWDEGRKLHQVGGMYMVGSKETLYHGGMRPGKPVITPTSRFQALQGELGKIDQLPPVGKGPIEEWFRAIKGDGPMPGSSFEYAVPLTEMVLLGALAQRTGTTIEWDAANMRVVGRPELDALIREPAREGWRYGAASTAN